jgi:hypothetical protein
MGDRKQNNPAEDAKAGSSLIDHVDHDAIELQKGIIESAKHASSLQNDK